MSAPTTDLLALLDSGPAAGILAAADLREQRAGEATWEGIEDFNHAHGHAFVPGADEYIAAEGSPAHALAAVRRWRAVVERWQRQQAQYLESDAAVVLLLGQDLRETADEARAYLGGSA